MRHLETDVLVIGGGMAGLAAATIAQQRGAETLLLRKGESATSMSSGAVDVLGYLPRSLEPIESPAEGLLGLASMYPLHPYVLLGTRSDSDVFNAHAVEEPIEWLKKTVDGAEFKLIGSMNENRFPICVLGSSKPTCLIQDTMDSGSVGEDDQSDVMLFVGIKGHADFNPRAAARSSASGRTHTDRIPHRVVDCVVDLAPFGHSFNVSSIELARHMDHQDGTNEFVAQIAKEVKRTRATRVVTPPILGLKKPRSNASVMAKELDVGVSELLSFPPSVPGCRLQDAMESAYVSAGGKIMLGFEASSCTVRGRLIGSVAARGPRRNVTIDTKSVVLASGKFIGGGLHADENGVRETALNLVTVTGEYYPASDIRPAHYSSRFAINPDGHPLFSCGVPVDSDMKPIDSDGHARFANLFAAGSVLAGYDYLSEKSGLGVALVTGYAAGLNATRFVAGGE